MSDRALTTLLELLEAFTVEVPIIQRDYAHGRQDVHAKMVRQNLLADMKQAIQGSAPSLDLDFVYGRTDSGKFYPVDGQQRLTTLFLLHLYAFHDDESKTELFHKFTYETRRSSRDFFKKLTQNRADVFSSEAPPSVEIEDSEWFVSGWINDPTIQSSLVMLDDIKEAFGEVDNLVQGLQENNLITFKFLEMAKLGMEDSMYIKLNARGRPLTPLENFKARLIDRLHELELGMDFTDSFKQDVDGKWTDVFWGHNPNSFDQTYMAFFGMLFMNKGLLSNDKGNWADMFDYKLINAEILKLCCFTLNFLSDNPERKDVHQHIISTRGDPTYTDRVLFHATTTYMWMAEGIDNGSLDHWLRIIQNLVFNTRIDQSDNYRRAVNGIDRLEEHWDNLLGYCANDGEISGFSREQIAEEQEKARIIQMGGAFAEAIDTAEQHPYFKGQIRSALHYSKSGNESPDLELFIKYWSKISALFGDDEPKHGHLLRQALLTFGDYTIQAGKINKTLCVSDPNENENSPSLKRLFSQHGDIVKQLLDVLDTKESIESQLKTIISNSTVPRNDWRHCFIHFPELFKEMSASHLRLQQAGEKIVVIPKQFFSLPKSHAVFLFALREVLKRKELDSDFSRDFTYRGDYPLQVKGLSIRFEKGKFTVYSDENTDIVFETETNDPLTEVSGYLLKHLGVDSIH